MIYPSNQMLSIPTIVRRTLLLKHIYLMVHWLLSLPDHYDILYINQFSDYLFQGKNSRNDQLLITYLFIYWADNNFYHFMQTKILILFSLLIGLSLSFAIQTEQSQQNLSPQISETTIPSYFLNSSKIADGQSRELLFNWLGYANARTHLLWRGSQHAFSFSSMHESVDYWGSILVFVKTPENYAFGGFISKSIDKERKSYEKDPGAFIFSLTRGTVHRQRNGTNSIIFNSPEYISFGQPSRTHWDDISIRYSCNLDFWSYSDFGFEFEPPSDIIPGTYAAQTYMAGSYRWRCVELEIWAVIEV